MKNSKFLVLLRTLSKNELADFGRYLKRLHSNDKVATAVFDYVRKQYPSLADERKLEIGHAFVKVFKVPLDEDRANRTKMLNALSDLHLWLKEFLMVEKLKVESFESKAFWMFILKERGLMGEFSRKAAILQQTVEEMPKSSVLDYMKGMVTNYFFYYYLTHDKQKLDLKMLDNSGADLDLYYAVSRLKIACEMANRQNLMSVTTSLEVLPAIIELSRSKEISNHPLFVLYQKVYELTYSDMGYYFKDLEHLLKENCQKVAPEELHTILGYLHNYAAARIRHGDESYLAMVHSLNMFAVEMRLLEKSGEISSSQFNNIITVACVQKDLKWASYFINECKQLLPENIRSEAVALAEALILFDKKEYREVIRKITSGTFPDLHHAIRCKSLILRCRYELADDNFDVEEFCLSFEAYLKRYQKPKREAVTATMNFVRIVKKMVRHKESKQQIINDIHATSPIYFKSWLLEKAASYKFY